MRVRRRPLHADGGPASLDGHDDLQVLRLTGLLLGVFPAAYDPNGDGLVDFIPDTSIFTPSNWDVAQTVTIRALSDIDLANDTTQLCLNGNSQDSDYAYPFS